MSEKPHSQDATGPLFGVHYIDNPPQGSVTADQVRHNAELSKAACLCTEDCQCEEKRLRWVLEQAIKHNGCSSSLRAALEAALE